MITMMNNTSKMSPSIQMDSFIEMHPLSMIDALPSPRILNKHVKTKYIPKESVQKKLKNVLLCRNPKDVVVSFYNHTKGFKLYEYDGKFESFLQMFMRGDVDCGSYPEYLLEWQEFIRSHPDVPSHVILYEDLKKNCVEELKRLRNFLELDVTNDLLREIADNCNIDKMRSSKAEVMSQEAKEGLKQIVNRGFSLLRKGQVGDWKNWFTVAQSEMFDAWWEKETKGFEICEFEFS